MNVVIWTLKIAGAMSKGLRKFYHLSAKAQFLSVISKFREKKTQMVDETFNTLNDFNHCLGIEDVLDDVKEGLGDKAPTMRCNLLNWIGKHVDYRTE
jgi:DNA-binding transcriptional regulator GbsR (MarR family)